MKKALGVITVFSVLLLFGACLSSPSASGTGASSSGGVNPADMVDIPGGTVTGSGNSTEQLNTFPDGRTVTINPFKMAKYQTTYALYTEVLQWSDGNGYSIVGVGTEGHGTDGTGASGTPEQRAQRPVTNITWMDAVVWCNAYSEKEKLTPVYRLASNGDEIIRDSSYPPEEAVMQKEANGYRLPTEAEWVYAARGGKPGEPSWNFRYAGSNVLNEVGWYKPLSGDVGKGSPNYGVHPVGQKKPNTLGLYDMSGNVWEWCWDWFSPNVTANDAAYTVNGKVVDPAGPDMSADGRKIFMGGGFRHTEVQCSMASRGNWAVRSAAVAIGFRVVRNK